MYPWCTLVFTVELTLHSHSDSHTNATTIAKHKLIKRHIASSMLIACFDWNFEHTITPTVQL